MDGAIISKEVGKSNIYLLATGNMDEMEKQHSLFMSLNVNGRYDIKCVNLPSDISIFDLERNQNSINEVFSEHYKNNANE